ncbi:unnamed protein product [Heterotrigona itama]|uniref:Uncharacterized protein n=1 Tax=Heterotrigona itama TaxID=395501 RepID=A0A6V7H075_9HYME|nr:unnamed protein product [Heterotrigona itama]
MVTSSLPNSAWQNECQEVACAPPVEGTTEIGSMTLQRLPPFRKENPKFWFVQVESAMAKLESDILSFVAHVVESPPVTDKYLTIKTRLLELFSQSEETKIPSSLHDILMASDSNDLARLASLADKITEFKSSQVSVASRGNVTGETKNVQENNMAVICRELLKQMEINE